MDSLQSQLLVASPRLPDNNFYRSVILMIQHDEEGAFGVVLNRPTNLSVSGIWEQIADESRETDSAIYLGGPVSGPLLAVHAVEEFAETEVLPGVFLSTDKETLDDITQQAGSPYRIFSGYSGWGPGQLDEEMESGGWMTLPATIHYIFGEHEDLWKTVAAEIGGQVVPAMNGDSAVVDPLLN